MSRGSWTGDDLEKVPLPDDLTECNKQQRRAYVYKRIREEGHPSLIDKVKISNETDVSRRQVYYDLDAVAEFVDEHIAGDVHTGHNYTVFEKAKRELMRRGDWKGAVEVLQDEAEWLERRGAIDKEPDEVDVEVEWRQFIESDDS